jgi:hypothetical protein
MGRRTHSLVSRVRIVTKTAGPKSPVLLQQACDSEEELRGPENLGILRFPIIGMFAFRYVFSRPFTHIAKSDKIDAEWTAE